ncbi:MAG: type I-A CRISPR-associated protein Cas7/Csa2, partial [Thermoplasmata archaeon]
MFVSVGVRFEAQVEAMNMVESIGNYTRHRKVPYIIKDKDGYKLVYVPAISGESIAHTYQYFLAQEAKALGLKVCNECLNGEFYKSMNLSHAESKGVKEGDSADTAEKKIVENCVVEDIGGFLIAEKIPAKRTSVFQVSYAVPIKSAVLSSIVDPQLHARQSLAPEKREEGRKEASEQMIFYVEVGTAIYGFVFNINLDRIGVSGITGDQILDDMEKRKRMEAAIRALLRMLSSMQFGAKLSRFFPNGKIKTILVSISEKPFVVSSPLEDTFIEDTMKRARIIREAFNEDVELIAFSDELEIPEGIKRVETPEE